MTRFPRDDLDVLFVKTALKVFGIIGGSLLLLVVLMECIRAT